MESLISKDIAPILKKQKFKKGSTKESELEKKRDELKNRFLKAKSLPRNTIHHALESVRELHGLSHRFKAEDLQKKLGPSKANIATFNETANSNFDSVWQEALENCEGGEQIDIEADGDKSKFAKKNIRTCSATLKQILRPDIMNYYDNIVGILNGNQSTITDIISELSILAQKTVIIVSHDSR